MMDDLRLAAVAARVVDWHNRHPLALRISAANVHAVGYIGLPFVGAPGTAPAPVPSSADDGADSEHIDLSAPEPGAAEAGAPEGGSLRERALARARQQAAVTDRAPPPPQATAPAAATSVQADAAPLPALATLLPDFNEDFIPPLRPAAVARFAARAGQVLARAPGDGPLRQVRAAGAHPGRLPARVYLLTAVIETDTRKSRVLLGTGLTAPVLGRRLFSTGRLAGVAALAASVLGVPTWLLQRPADAPGGPAPTVAQAPEPAMPPASAAPAAVVAAAPVDGAASMPDAVSAVVSEPAPSARPVASAPALAATAARAAALAPGPLRAASAGVLPLPAAVADRVGAAPSIRPVISEADKALARQARQAARPDGRPETPAPAPAPAPVPAPVPVTAPAAPVAPPARAVAMPAPALPPAPVLTAAAPTPPAPNAVSASAAAPAPGSAFALSTRPLRTRAEAEQVQVAMRSLLRTLGAADFKVDVLPQGDDWRVVGYPFSRRADADRARTLLVSRGMRVEVVGF